MRITAQRLDVLAGAIYPPHDVDRPKQYEQIKRSMERHGWRGRAVLAVTYGDGYMALTGSHRIAAAREAGLATIPALVLDVQLTDRETKRMNETGEMPAKYVNLEASGWLDFSKPSWGIPSDEGMPDVLDVIGAPRSAVRLAEKEIALVSDRGAEA